MYYYNNSYKSNDKNDMAKFLGWEEDAHDVLSSYFLSELTKLPIHGTYTIQHEVNRPDLLALNIKEFGSMRYWWVIMFYNGLSSNEELVNGLEIKYPSVNNVEKLNMKAMSTKS